MPAHALDDVDGPRLPESLPPVIDAHVHLFPERLFQAIWRWFDRHGWPIRHKLTAEAVTRFLFERGVSRIVALHYAHKPGIAREMNAFMARLCAADRRITGLATVFPGEPGATDILNHAFAEGLSGVKLHCHVQAFAPDDPNLHEIYALCARQRKPLVMHAGREPQSPAYPVDVYRLCAADRVDRVLCDHPTLKLCVPHLGMDEFDAYGALLERHDHLWLDTTMVGAAYFPVELPRRLLEIRHERVLYGTDFPNIPYAWDREVKQLQALKLRDDRLAALLGGNAEGLYGG
jgi:predicted TIM-barrel fold metal-dependent hydrolase